MDRMPEEESGGTEEKRSAGRPMGPSLLLVLLVVLGVFFALALLKTMEAPEVRWDSFWAELEKGNIKEFQFAGEMGLGKLKGSAT